MQEDDKTRFTTADFSWSYVADIDVNFNGKNVRLVFPFRVSFLFS